MNNMEKIYDILDNTLYATLALVKGIVPYSVPVNFVRIDKFLYFHGSKNGKKMNFIDINKNVSLSIVKPYSIIPSYFSSNSGLACPATHFFSSVIIDGTATIITNPQTKTNVLNALMSKLQKEGGYQNLNNNIYKNRINNTAIVKITPYNFTIKEKFGQKLPQERFSMIIKKLTKRGSKLDLQTIDKMLKLKA